jgi:hypothetical protein
VQAQENIKVRGITVLGDESIRENETHFICCTHNCTFSGPALDSSEEDIAEFYKWVRKTNEEKGKEYIRVYDPRKQD